MNAAILTARTLASAEGKRRETPVIWHYTEEHFLTVVDWMLSGISYKKVRDLCASDLKLPPAKIDSISALSRFWEEFSGYYLIASRRAAVQLSNEVAGEAEKEPGRFDQATLDAIKQKAFELAISPVSAPKEVKALMTLLLKSRDQDLKLQTIELEVEKFKTSIRTKLEAGLEALFLEIKSNPKALAKFQELKKEISAA